MCEFVRERECVRASACERVRVRARESVCACAIGFKVRVLCEGKSFGIFSYKKTTQGVFCGRGSVVILETVLNEKHSTLS